MNEVMKAERSMPCSRCHAKPGEPCRTVSGARRSWAHAERWQAAKDAGLLPIPHEIP